MSRLLGLALLACLFPQAEPDPHRQRVVDRLGAVIAELAKLDSMSYEVEKSVGQASDANPPRTTRDKVTLKRPNLGRVESLSPQSGLRIADGKHMWSGSPTGTSYSKFGQNQSTFTRYFESDYLASRLFFLKDPEEVLRKQGDIAVEKGTIDGAAYAVLCWKGIDSYGNLRETRLWINDKNLPRRIERKWERPSFGGGLFIVVLETDEISKLEVNPTLAADIFGFTPAAGASEMDLIESNTRGNLPEDAAAATDVLEGVRKSLQAVEAIDYTVEITLEGGKVDPKTQPLKRRVRAKRPAFVRIDGVSPVENKTVLVDGEWTWTFEKDKKSYMRTWLLDPYLSSGPENDPWFRLFWERRPTRLFARGKDVTLTREKLGDVECHRIDWIRMDAYAMTAKGGGDYEVRWKFWMDLQGKPRRVIKEQEHGDVKYVETSTYGEVDLKAKPDAEVFKFEPPADWKKPPTWPDEILLAAGTPAPAIEGTGLDGKSIKLADYKGQAVILTFWDLGSAFCVEELANLAPLHKEYGKRGVAFLAVSRETPPKSIEQHFKRNDLPFTAILQKQFEINVAFNVRLLPTTYLLDKEGKVAATWISVERGELKSALEKALK